MYKREGLNSLYRGVFINSFAGFVANSVFFYIYQDGKKWYNYDSNNPFSTKTILIS